MDAEAAVRRYLEIADDVAPGLIEGLYVVGSYALGDWIPGHSDVDIVAVTAEPATDEDYGSLRTVHALLSEEADLPAIDGPYLAWGDLLAAPATGLHRPWSLDGTLHHDGDCFELNPVTWYVLREYGVTARGPSPTKLDIWVDTDDRIRFVVQNLLSYWAGVANDVQASCAQERDSFTAESFEWCALGALRLHFTAFTGDVTSKRGAGEHGLLVAPDTFHPMLTEALRIRADASGSAAALGVSSERIAQAAALISWCVDEARRATG